MSVIATLVRVALVAILGAVAGIMTAAPAHAATTATLVRLPSSPIAGGYGLEIRIGFDTNAPITQWRLEFDLPPDTFPNPWSGLPFSRSGNRWTVNYVAHSPQYAGSTFVHSFAMLGLGHPTNCLINGNPCVYIVENDTQPPTTPTNLTATRFSGESPWGPYAYVYLTWGSSTDNLRLAGYQISANGQIVENTGLSPTHVHLAYTTQQVTYSIRAYDSVGNLSAPATVVLPAL